jgi:hypothetical protein
VSQELFEKNHTQAAGAKRFNDVCQLVTKPLFQDPTQTKSLFCYVVEHSTLSRSALLKKGVGVSRGANAREDFGHSCRILLER